MSIWLVIERKLQLREKRDDPHGWRETVLDVCAREETARNRRSTRDHLCDDPDTTEFRVEEREVEA